MSVPRLRGEAENALAQAEDILRFLSAEYGPCPYADLRLVLSENVTPGGHSAPGTVLLSSRPALLPGELRDDPARLTTEPGFFLAHEIAHQWWGHAVAGENYHERWISEGFAQYAAATWVRHRYGDAEFQSMLRRMAAWSTRASGGGPIRLGGRL